MNETNAISNAIASHPTAVVVCGSALLFLSFVGLLSDKVAETGGRLGGLARAYKEWRRKAAAEDHTRLAGRIERLEEGLARVDAENRKLHDYVIYVTRWFHDLSEWAAREGHTLPPPPFIYWTEFRDRNS